MLLRVGVKGACFCVALRAWICALNLSRWTLCLLLLSASGRVSGSSDVPGWFAGTCAAWKGAVAASHCCA